MKFAIISALIMSAAVLGSQLPQKPVIVTYPDNTPDEIITAAQEDIKAAGGTITHVFTLIRGFSAEASATTLDAIQALNNEFPANVEDEQVVTTTGTDN